MKNRAVNFILAVTILFIGITIGFSLGRNTNHQDVTLSVTPPVTNAASAPTEFIATETTAPEKTKTVTAGTTYPDTVPDDTTLPPPDTTSPPPSDNPPETTESGPVFPINVNTADQQTLMLLPGIGEVLAQRIIDYRQANGDFSALEELMNIDGIGTKRLEGLWDYATTE